MKIGVLNFLVSSFAFLTGRVILKTEPSRIEYVTSYLPQCAALAIHVYGAITYAKIKKYVKKKEKYFTFSFLDSYKKRLCQNEAVSQSLFFLFLSDKYIHRSSAEIPLLAQLVLKETLVRVFYILRQVAEKHKTWNLCVWQLHTELNLDILALD